MDSRVPPELVFDLGLGDLFVSRMAAAIAVDAVVGAVCDLASGKLMFFE